MAGISFLHKLSPSLKHRLLARCRRNFSEESCSMYSSDTLQTHTKDVVVYLSHGFTPNRYPTPLTASHTLGPPAFRTLARNLDT